ncbi:MAG: hypothetical protein V1900_03790 [Candidatus Aenigmatarchaeota archaeon]
MPIEKGERYYMHVVGTGRGGERYGWIKRVRVLIYREFSGKCFPGEGVEVRIDNVREHSAEATLLENKGCFIRENDIKNVMLTGRSDSDARDAVSSPVYPKGGIYGCLAIVKNTKFRHIGDEYLARVLKVSRGKHNNYSVVAELTDKSLERDPEKDLFVYEWDEIGCRPSAGMRRVRVDPTIDEIPDMISGVPTSLSTALYFMDSDTRLLLNKRGYEDASRLGPADAVREYVGRCDSTWFKLALARPEGLEALMRGIADSGLGIEPEKLDKKQRPIP